MSEEIKKETQGMELNPEDLENVAGGYIFGQGLDRDYRWEIISDMDGRVVGRYKTKEQAMRAAKEMGISTQEITWSELNKLRNP